MAVVDRVDTEVPNLFWSYTKNEFRAIFVTEEEDGSTKQSEFLTESKDLAMTFVKTGIRPQKIWPAHMVGCRCSTCRNRKRDDALPAPPVAEDEDAASCSGSDDRSSADNS